MSVYRLVTKNTVDENVLAIAERKLALDAAVLSDFVAGGEGDEAAAAKKGGRPGLDSKEVKNMGAILAELLSSEQ